MNFRPWSPGARYFALALVLFFFLFIGWQIRELFWPLIVAGLIAYILYPFVSLIQRQFRLKRKLASNIVYFLSLALMVAMPIVLVPILSRQTAEITADLNATLTQAQQYLSVPVLLGGFSIDLGNIIPQIRSAVSNLNYSTPQNTLLLLRNTSRGTLWGLIIIVSAYFFMTEWENVREGMIHIAPEEYRPDVRRLYDEIRQVWMAYLRGQLTLMIIVAITFTIVWTIIGLPGSLYLGFLAGLFSIVPDVGPFAATVLALAVALLEGSTWMPINNFLFGLLVVGLYIVLINIKNIWLRPYILGRSVHMHEAIVFVAIIAAVFFTGIVGAFIIVPVLASLGVIWRYLHARILGVPPYDLGAEIPPYPELEPVKAAASEVPPAPRPARKKSSKS
jgi:predicted PurR-regulated permease PerM